MGEEEQAAHRHQDTTELSTARTRFATDMPGLIPHRHRQPGGRFATVALPEAVGFRVPERFEAASDIAPILATRAEASGYDASGYVPSRGSQPS